MPLPMPETKSTTLRPPVLTGEVRSRAAPRIAEKPRGSAMAMPSRITATTMPAMATT